MSHFVVVVLGPDVDAQLAPYDENDHLEPVPGEDYQANPQGYWGWWTVGGRWSGWLGRDHGLAKQFDFEALRDKAALEAHTDYRRIRPAGIDPPPFTWKQCREELHPDDIDAARDTWASHPFNAAVRTAEAWAHAEDFFVDIDTYVARAQAGAVVPYAVVAEGAWMAKGQMGPFGSSRDVVSDDDWNGKVNELFDNLSPEMEMTVVDCHV